MSATLPGMEERAPRSSILVAAGAGELRLPLVVAAAVVAVIAVGAALNILLPERAFDSYLGAPHPPFLWLWRPRIDPLAAVALPAFALAVGQAPRLLDARLKAPTFAVAVFGLALALRLALAAAREGPSGWYAAFDTGFNAGNEYLPSLPSLELGLAAFLDRFDQLAPSLSVHPSAHPPGMLVTLHLLEIDGVVAMAWLVILAGTLAAPLTYVLGRRLLDERRARLAALLFACSPSALIYGASSADALFVTLGLAAAIALVTDHRLVAVVLGPALLALAAFFSYALLALGAWAVLLRLRLRGALDAARLVLASAAGLALACGGLYAATGFDSLGSLAAADGAYRASIATVRPYAYWVFGSPAAFIVALGIPIAWYATRAVAERHPAALALAAIVLVAAVGGFSKAETERVWLFMVPLACVAAAYVLPSRKASGHPRSAGLPGLRDRAPVRDIW